MVGWMTRHPTNILPTALKMAYADSLSAWTTTYPMKHSTNIVYVTLQPRVSTYVYVSCNALTGHRSELEQQLLAKLFPLVYSAGSTFSRKDNTEISNTGQSASSRPVYL